MHPDYLLKMEKVSLKRYNTTILNNVCLDIVPSAIHSLIGRNSSGKSSIAKVLSGQYSDYTGKIYLNGKDVFFNSIFDAKKNGIYLCSQELAFFNNLTVLENMVMGTSLDASWCNTKKRESKCKEILKSIKLNIPLTKTGSNLSMTEKFLIQLSRQLVDTPKLLILDELTDSLTFSEINIINDILLRLREKGSSILLITHNINDAIKISDYITIIKDGTTISTKKVSDYNRDSITNELFGEKSPRYYPKLDIELKSIVLSVDSICTDFLNNISFDLHRGEILGIAGLGCSGRSRLLKTIYGIEKIKSGSIEFDIPNTSSIAYLPEEREQEGIFNNLSIKQNISIKALNKIKRAGILSPTYEHMLTEDMIERLGIDIPKNDHKITHLSGGNKQKVLLARYILSNCSIFIFDEPTMGLDIAAKVDIYNILNELARKGAAVLLVSSDFSELTGMCDRLLVIKNGSIVSEIYQSELKNNADMLKFIV